jgi:hypothetical protein
VSFVPNRLLKKTLRVKIHQENATIKPKQYNYPFPTKMRTPAFLLYVAAFLAASTVNIATSSSDLPWPPADSTLIVPEIVATTTTTPVTVDSTPEVSIMPSPTVDATTTTTEPVIIQEPAITTTTTTETSTTPSPTEEPIPSPTQESIVVIDTTTTQEPIIIVTTTTLESVIVTPTTTEGPTPTEETLTTTEPTTTTTTTTTTTVAPTETGEPPEPYFNITEYLTSYPGLLNGLFEGSGTALTAIPIRSIIRMSQKFLGKVATANTEDPNAVSSTAQSILPIITNVLQTLNLREEIFNRATTVLASALGIVSNGLESVFRSEGFSGCWMGSFSRGDGTLPDACPVGYDYTNSTCYASCNPGYAPLGTVCWNGTESYDRLTLDPPVNTTAPICQPTLFESSGLCYKEPCPPTHITQGPVCIQTTCEPDDSLDVSKPCNLLCASSASVCTDEISVMTTFGAKELVLGLEKGNFTMANKRLKEVGWKLSRFSDCPVIVDIPIY